MGRYGIFNSNDADPYHFDTDTDKHYFHRRIREKYFPIKTPSKIVNNITLNDILEEEKNTGSRERIQRTLTLSMCAKK